MGAALSSLRSGRRRGPALRPVDAAAAAADAADGGGLWIVVGLGNPGPRYAGTRHNVGWAVIDALAARAGCALDRAQCNAAVGRGTLAGARVLLAKPLTFMNVSGEAVGGLAKFYRVPPERVIAVYDDMDTAVSKVRLRRGGGHGGHNGVRSLIQHFGGSKDFARVRVGECLFFCMRERERGGGGCGRGERGHDLAHPPHSLPFTGGGHTGIGRPPDHIPVVAYVLQDFGAGEREGVAQAVEESADAVCAVLGLGLEKALSGVRLPGGGSRA